MEKKDLRERLVDIMHYDGTYSTSDLVKFIQQELDKAREDGIRYALSEVQGRVGVQNEEVYVLCNAILQESLIFDNK